jgi:hypothetical protein
MARLGFVLNQIREIEEARRKRLEQEPETGTHAMVRAIVRKAFFRLFLLRAPL